MLNSHLNYITDPKIALIKQRNLVYLRGQSLGGTVLYFGKIWHAFIFIVKE